MKTNKATIPAKLRAKIQPWKETRRRAIAHAVKKAKNDMWLAAKLLGVGRDTIYNETIVRKTNGSALRNTTARTKTKYS
jgi:transcriptional regulator of acetoin/glycerol metabolism